MKNEPVAIDFDLRERMAREYAARGHHQVAGVLQQDIIVMRDLLAKQAPTKGAPVDPEKEPIPAPQPDEPPAPEQPGPVPTEPTPER